jgi:hypothetical protein
MGKGPFVQLHRHDFPFLQLFCRLILPEMVFKTEATPLFSWPIGAMLESRIEGSILLQWKASELPG